MNINIDEIKKIVNKKIRGRISSISIEKGGSSSITHKIVNNFGEVYYFKVNDNNHELELELTNKLTKLGVRLPEIIANDKKWMLTRAALGVSLNELKDDIMLAKAIEKAGEMVAIINSVNVEGFGPLVSVYRGLFNSYELYYKELIQKLPANIQDLTTRYIRKINKAFLCHGDIYNSHLYSNKEGEIITIIDIDDMLGANQFYDLAEYDVSHKRDEKIWKLFTSGYGKVLPIPTHNSLDLKLEEYLILFESYLFTLKNHPEQKDNLELKKEKLQYLEQLIL